MYGWRKKSEKKLRNEKKIVILQFVMEQKQYDKHQLEAIGISGGHHLVLAPPGCGKTDILAERIVQARERGVDYSDMLCLTFTNRAAKGMAERIEERTGNPVPQQLFVGNVHRYCSQLLFENGVMPAGSAIIDDVDMDNIIRDELLREPELRATPMDIFKLQHTLWQLAKGHRGDLVLHNYLLKEPALKKLCTLAGMPFSEHAVGFVYTHIDSLIHEIHDRTVFHFASRIKVARNYQHYKEENDIIDFDDILILAYDYAASNPDSLRRFRWIQVDEVQDLNSLQFAIIDLLTAPPEQNPTVVYLGDEQQAIYSFIGAKIETLQRLRKKCEGNIHHLYRNYRSPRYLLDLLNHYATLQLGIRPELLPMTTAAPDRAPEDLCLLDVGDAALEPYYIARFAKRYAELGDGRVAILVSTNKAADAVAEILETQHLDIFKISGTDLFSTHEVRLLLAHMTVVTDESVFIAWARLLNLLGVIASYSKARDFMRQLKRLAIAPTDLLSDSGRTYIRDFVDVCSNQTCVIFDTETTGLDIYNDDIIQIAAVKVRDGRVVPASRFNIIIETDREIPAEVGGGPNPMLEVYATSRRYSRAEGLRMFADYCHGYTLVGHNVEYDYNILYNNIKRSCPGLDADAIGTSRFDTLKLIRLLQPRLKKYKLGYLLEKLHLDGQNSHRADDDIMATLELMNYCHREALERLPHQEQYLADPTVIRIAQKFLARYAHHYRHTVAQLHLPQSTDSQTPALAAELDYTYRRMLDEGIVGGISKWQHLMDYLALDLVDAAAYPTLALQLQRYITALNTCKEADLCGNSLKERFLVTTVHKAKGLEFETVIIADAIDGTYPFGRSWTELQLQEDARRLYVAMSRAKRRLCVVYSDYAGTTPHQLTPFLHKLVDHFSHYRRDPLTGKIVLV